ARFQAADATHHYLHRHTRLRGPVERVDDLLVDDRVGLQPDSRRDALAGEFDLALDSLDDACADTLRGNQQIAVVRLSRISGQRVEQVGQIGADFRCGGEQSDVLVQARGLRVVVAGAD